MSLLRSWKSPLGRWRGRTSATGTSPQARLAVECLEARTTPVCMTGSFDACFLDQAYRDLLGRSPDPAGLAAWGQLLGNGVSRAQVALGITQSPEFRALVVQRTFADFLRRPAEPAALGFFSGFLGAGASIEQMQALVLGSAEYVTLRGGGTALGFVSALFVDVLGRPVDPAAASLFTQALAAGVAPSAVALTVLTSAERATSLVQSFYLQLLRRPADPGGLAGFVTALGSGTRQELVLAVIVGSEEYLTHL